MQYQLRFESLHNRREALVFPCDASGIADMDSMDAATRNHYLYARALVGVEYGPPRVCLLKEGDEARSHPLVP